jgi:NADH-quinone oxidoreductase B subunit
MYPLFIDVSVNAMSIFKKIMNWARIKSPWILHFNSGACNACDIEIIAALTPRFDIERFGIQLKGSPRHADVLVCSGPVTRQIEARLKRIYEQMPEPKFVVAVGTCACSGGVFKGCYNVKGGIDQVIPVTAYIPGCPASPRAIIDGVVKLLRSLEEKK